MADKYIILSSKFPKMLVKEVNRFMDNGYKPQGGVVFAQDQYDQEWAQAMIKETE